MNSPQRLRSIHSFFLAATFVIGGARALAQAPLNDNLAAATILSGTNVSATGTTVGATAELDEPAHAGFPASHSIWYLWTAPDDGSTLIDLTGSASGTVVAVYTGKYMASLTPVASNAGGNSGGTGRCVFSVTAGVLYDIAVDVSGAPGLVDLNLQFTRSYFPPQITQQPAPQTVLEGGTAMFSVTATSDAPMSYQWLDNGGNAISWGTNSVLILTNALLSQGGNYQVVVSNAGGSVTSTNALLTVNPRPVNDDFANRIALSGSAVTTTGSDVYATAQPGEPSPDGWSSPQSVWWTWTAPTNGLAFVDVTNDTGNQVLAIYTGDTLAQLVSVTSASWFTPPLAVEFEVAGGTIYQITVAGVGGLTGAFQLDLSFIPTNFPPTITQQPTGQTVAQGGTATFQVVAVSGLPISYQWQFNGSPIAGGTNPTLVLTNVSASQAGPYQVMVSNAGGTVPSAAIPLTVNVPPSNDDFVNAQPLSGIDVTTTGDNQFATSEPGEPSHGGYPPGASVWWNWTTPAVGDAVVNVTGFSGEETLGVYTGNSVSNLALVTSNSWAAGLLSVHFAATNPGAIYRIAVADPSGNGSSFQLHATLAISNFPPTVVQQPPPVTNVTLSVTNYLRWVLQSDFPVTGQWFLDGFPFGGGGGVSFGGGDGGGGGDTGTARSTWVVSPALMAAQTSSRPSGPLMDGA